LIGGSYGPVSNQQNGHIVVEWSNIDDHLTNLQDEMMQEDANWPGYYCFFADQGFFAGRGMSSHETQGKEQYTSHCKTGGRE
jgi:hypothetical protein